MPTCATSCGIVQGAREGIVLLDASGDIVSLNAAARHMFGCAEPALRGRPFETLIEAPAAAPAQAGATAERIGPSWTRLPDGCLGRRADGSQFPIDLEVTRIGAPHNSGQPASFAVYVRDLGVESALQQELETADRRLRAVIELAPIAIWIAHDDHLIFANRAAGSLMGVASGDALVGQSVFAMVSAADHAGLRHQLRQALSHEGRRGQLQAHLVRGNNEAREVEIALAALPDHGRTTVQMVVSDVSQRNREMRDIERSRQLLRRLSTNVVEAREEERRRIARELHDELGQSLSALKMDIASCARPDASAAEKRHVADVLQRLDGIMKSVRRIATDLRPLMLDDLGLGDAIDALAGDLSRRLGVRIHLHVEPLEPAVDEKVSIALYRMVQEALTNIARHAQASEVHIDIGRQGDELVLSVRDDGVGLPWPPPPQRDSQFGLLGMQERAHALGGRLELENQPDGGACVRVRLPLPGSADAAAAAAGRKHTG